MICINEKLVQSYDMSMETLLLLMILNNRSLKDILKDLKNAIGRDYIERDPDTKFKITKKGKHFIDYILLNSDKDLPEGTNLENLVEKMRNLFPEGKKEGTTYYWRGNQTELIRKLRVFYKKYGKYSEEDILDATKRYVESFNGDYRFMQLLKYFIIKSSINASREVEEKSELASYIENKNQENDNNWLTTLV